MYFAKNSRKAKMKLFLFASCIVLFGRVATASNSVEDTLQQMKLEIHALQRDYNEKLKISTEVMTENYDAKIRRLEKNYDEKIAGLEQQLRLGRNFVSQSGKLILRFQRSTHFQERKKTIWSY